MFIECLDGSYLNLNRFHLVKVVKHESMCSLELITFTKNGDWVNKVDVSLCAVEKLEAFGYAKNKPKDLPWEPKTFVPQTPQSHSEEKKDAPSPKKKSASSKSQT